MASIDLRKSNTHPARALVKAYDFFRRWPVIPVAVILILLLSAIFAPIVAPYDPLDGDLRARTVPPVWTAEGSSEYLFGTDHIGRDILSRTIHGGRVSFQVAAAVLVAGAGVGTLVGLASGYLGGVVDEVFMRLTDFAFAMPFIVIALVASVVWGPSLLLVIILLSIFTWPPVRPAGPGRSASAQRGRLRRARARGWSFRLQDSFQAHPTRCVPDCAGPLVAAGRIPDSNRVGIELLGSRNPAATTLVGQHRSRWSRLHSDGLVDIVLPRSRHTAGGVLDELLRRLAQGQAGPASQADIVFATRS